MATRSRASAVGPVNLPVALLEYLGSPGVKGLVRIKMLNYLVPMCWARSFSAASHTWGGYVLHSGFVCDPVTAGVGGP